MPHKTKEEKNIYLRNWRKQNKEHCNILERERRWIRHGVKDFEYDDYLVLLKKQKDKCKICKQIMQSPCVDHNHKTGKVRGLLCIKCNAALGHFGDTLEKLMKGPIKYLQNND